MGSTSSNEFHIFVILDLKCTVFCASCTERNRSTDRWTDDRGIAFCAPLAVGHGAEQSVKTQTEARTDRQTDRRIAAQPTKTQPRRQGGWLAGQLLMVRNVHGVMCKLCSQVSHAGNVADGQSPSPAYLPLDTTHRQCALLNGRYVGHSMHLFVCFISVLEVWRRCAL